MSQDSRTAAIESFFAEHPMPALQLPDGWPGRPYDTVVELESAEVRGEVVTLTFRGGHQLTFVGGLTVERAADGLRLGGFAEVTWEQHEYGQSGVHRATYSSGAVSFAVLPG